MDTEIYVENPFGKKPRARRENSTIEENYNRGEEIEMGCEGGEEEPFFYRLSPPSPFNKFPMWDSYTHIGIVPTFSHLEI